ncbi:RND family efflux transporter, MFP subunit [Bernardetia litoralis DSM 6794]|uniref:RND family efflux transporter, MFP subunit n=1 Tax=Bernardetia litoralis (strain ATCC 23117 / DSM 6794 / NBRC 15988 / NCIMB 1366 / Fx l1 / Sio-4) TaxID=880071 RepID=I4AMV4_BERLS|nr:efflux RND transporter periplasmic adaptor subunit [Bernardetia litoralis]AFM05289.1 RND family efflux transporter, MFP subunit [Bernardetia litoralis DSM 6794]
MYWIYLRNKKLIYVSCWFIAICICTSCRNESKNNTENEAQDSTKQNTNYQIKPTKVEIQEVKKQNLDYIIYTNGKVVAKQQAEIGFLASGKIEKIYINNGDYVRQGQTIASLENKEAVLRLRRAKEEKAIKHDEYRKLFIDFGGEWGNESSISDTLKQILRTRSGLALSEIQEAEAAQNLENSLLKAPFSGKVANLFVSKGTFISASSPICVLYSSQNLEVEAFVPESEVLILSDGKNKNKQNKADISPITSLSNAVSYESYLVDINPQVENEGLVKLRFALPSTKEVSQNLLLNMNVTIALHIPQQKQLVVPKEAIVLRSEKEVVFSYENKRAFWNFVKTGKENGKEIEILEGLKEGQQIIISNNLQLSHDAEVEL